MRKINLFLTMLALIGLTGCTGTFHGIAQDFQNLGKGMSGTASGSAEESDSPPSQASASLPTDAPQTAPQQTDMQRAQERLKMAGYDPGPVDGVLGPKTQSALLKYQMAQGLPATGTLDDQTRKALGVGSSQ